MTTSLFSTTTTTTSQITWHMYKSKQTTCVHPLLSFLLINSLRRQQRLEEGPEGLQFKCTPLILGPIHSISGLLIPCFIVAFLGADGGAIGASSQAKSPGVGNADRGVYSSYVAAHDTKQAHKKGTSPTNRTSQKARPDSGRWNTTSPTLTWTPKPCVLFSSLL